MKKNVDNYHSTAYSRIGCLDGYLSDASYYLYISCKDKNFLQNSQQFYIIFFNIVWGLNYIDYFCIKSFD